MESSRQLVFLYSSQGLQHADIGLGSLAERPASRDALAACDSLIAGHLGWSLLEELQGPLGQQRLHEHQGMIQPALTALQIAFSRLLLDEGIRPDAVAGLSMGEVAASHTAGALSLEQAMDVVCCQAALTQRPLRPGAMAFVMLDAPSTSEFLGGMDQHLHIAVELAPDVTIISGEAQGVASGLATLQAQGIRCGIVRLGAAYHSPEVALLQGEFMQILAGLETRPESTPVYSSVTGGRIDGGRLTADYWWSVVGKPARLVSMIRQLLDDGFRTFIEIGPGPMLRESVLTTARPLDVPVTVISPGDEPSRSWALDHIHAALSASLAKPPLEREAWVTSEDRSSR
jgi:acyl transferase domain-containing protein